MEEKKFKFGFKSKRAETQEEIMKYEFPYVEIIPSKKKGSVTKFRLLNGAATLLNVEDEINKVTYFQLDDEKEFYLANTSKLDANPYESKLNKDNSFNNKLLHLRICDNLDLNKEETLYFKVEKIENLEGYEGLNIIKFVEIENINDEVEENNENAPSQEEISQIVDNENEVINY